MKDSNKKFTSNICYRLFEGLISKWSAIINEAKFEIKI